jgi:hypothetical protein
MYCEKYSMKEIEYVSWRLVEAKLLMALSAEPEDLSAFSSEAPVDEDDDLGPTEGRMVSDQTSLPPWTCLSMRVTLRGCHSSNRMATRSSPTPVSSTLYPRTSESQAMLMAPRELVRTLEATVIFSFVNNS